MEFARRQEAGCAYDGLIFSWLMDTMSDVGLLMIFKCHLRLIWKM
jgi:hypothetical protein